MTYEFTYVTFLKWQNYRNKDDIRGEEKAEDWGWGCLGGYRSGYERETWEIYVMMKCSMSWLYQFNVNILFVIW